MKVKFCSYQSKEKVEIQVRGSVEGILLILKEIFDTSASSGTCKEEVSVEDFLGVPFWAKPSPSELTEEEEYRRKFGKSELLGNCPSIPGISDEEISVEDFLGVPSCTLQEKLKATEILLRKPRKG